MTDTIRYGEKSYMNQGVPIAVYTVEFGKNVKNNSFFVMNQADLGQNFPPLRNVSLNTVMAATATATTTATAKCLVYESN